MSANKNDEKVKIVEEAWLDFFNQVLLKKGVITKEDYQRMAVKILTRNSSRAAAISISVNPHQNF